jgi:hypothetical protein
MLRVQVATAVGPEHHLPSDFRLRVFVPGAKQKETRCVDFWHMDYDFASSCSVLQACMPRSWMPHVAS